MKARGKQYPTVSAVAMNAVDHPFGGSAKPGQPKTISSMHHQEARLETLAHQAAERRRKTR